MRDTWKIAALCAAWVSVGVVGCARGPEDPAEEANQTLMTPAQGAEEDITDEEALAEELMSVEDTSEIEDAHAQPIGPPIGPPGRPPFGPRFRAPLCRHGSQRVRVGRGYICVGPGPFSPLPFCPGRWQLTRVGRGYLCERGFGGPPFGPFGD